MDTAEDLLRAVRDTLVELLQTLPILPVAVAAVRVAREQPQERLTLGPTGEAAFHHPLPAAQLREPEAAEVLEAAEAVQEEVAAAVPVDLEAPTERRILAVAVAGLTRRLLAATAAAVSSS